MQVTFITEDSFYPQYNATYAVYQKISFRKRRKCNPIGGGGYEHSLGKDPQIDLPMI